MEEGNRGKKAFYGVVSGFSNEIISLICGLILPRLILSTFGSTYNGLTSSISQFISVISIMRAGIGGVTKAALYKPLAKKNYHDISIILNQTQKFMRKIAMLFLLFVVGFATIYSLFFNNDFDFWFTFSLVVIISITTFAQYYFGYTRQMLLIADQKQYLTTTLNSILTILNTVIAVILIVVFDCRSIHIVKLASALVFVISPIFFYFYTEKKYHIDKSLMSKEDQLQQRWDAVGHEIANFVNNNTDVVVLTIFTDLKTVSVYSIYYYVVASIKKVLSNFVTGFGAAFGNMYAKKQYKLLEENFRIYELIVFSLASIIYTTTFVMLTPFVLVYTSGVTDVSYNRVAFGMVLTLAGAFSCFKIPYEGVTKSLGYYKATRNASFIEAGVNITISIACVFKLGLIGVAIGTAVAMAYRATRYAIFLSKNIIKRSLFAYIKHVILCLGVGAITFLLSRFYMAEIENFYMWVIYAIITSLIAIGLTLVTNLIFYKEDAKRFLPKLKGIVSKKGK